MNSRTLVSHGVPQRAFICLAALLFFCSAALTTAWCASMSAMEGMTMPGGWTMSMAWMRMPGQTWSDAATAFVSMWALMMVAMMLPVLVPTLWRYRVDISRSGALRVGALTLIAGAGYFCVWILSGAAAYPLGVGLAAAEMRLPALARVVPLATGVIVLIAGALQLSAWKARRLACCQAATARGRQLSTSVRTAWRHGLRLGIDCAFCCAPLTIILLVIGVMNLRAMAMVTLAITAERLLPARARIAQVMGYAIVAGGLLQIARAVSTG